MEIETKTNLETVKNSKKNVFFSLYVLQPFSGGLFGFAIFFSVLLITKSITLLLGVTKNFNIDINDVILALIGFVLLFVIKLLENVGRNRRPE